MNQKQHVDRSSSGQPKSRSFIDPSESHKTGLAGFFETLMRRFKTVLHISLIVPFYLFGAAIVGWAVVPAVLMFTLILEFTSQWGLFARSWVIGSTVVASVFITAISMMFILPLANFILLFGKPLKPWRGPYYSLEAIRWYMHNGVLYLLRYSFLELFTPSPMAIMFYKLMGMKVGNGAVINTTHISDPSLITIGKKVTLGGSATIVGHYGQAGYLVLAPVEIGDGATIGLKATIMGGVKVGENARVMAHSVVLPKTEIPAGETWGGVPAAKIS